jgi:thioredoxin-like negative regulator of GroEL
MSLVFLMATSALGFYADGDGIIDHSVESFENEVLGGDRLWVIEFYAPWCGNCRVVSPWYKEAAATMLSEAGVPFGALNMDGAGREFADRYGVTGLPHIMAFVPGQDEPNGMAGLGGAESIVNFAKVQLEALPPVQKMAHEAEAIAAGEDNEGDGDKDEENPEGTDIRPYSLNNADADHHAHAIEMDEAGNVQAAIASFRAATKFVPSESANWCNFGTSIMSQLIGTSHNEATEEETRIIQEATASFKQAVLLDPTNQDALLSLSSLADEGNVEL